MMRLHLKKQICMEVGCMQDNVIDLMDWIPELITLVLFGVGIMVLIGFVIYAVYMYYWGVWND
jgi:hypothetical protein